MPARKTWHPFRLRDLPLDEWQLRHDGVCPPCQRIWTLSAFALDPERPLPSRVLAVRALAWIGQREELPWETRVVSGLDYVDAPSTLTDPGGYGMVDL